MQTTEDFESLIITSFTCEQDQSINYSSSPADATHFPPLKTPVAAFSNVFIIPLLGLH